MGIPRTLRDFQARWKSRFFDFSSARLFHGLASRQFPVENRTAALVVATQTVRSIAEAQASVEVLVRDHRAARQRSPPAHGLDLQNQVLKADRVIPVHRTLELQRKDARWKSQKTDFPTALGNPAKCARFPLFRRLDSGYGRLTKPDISLATKSGHFNLLRT